MCVCVYGVGWLGEGILKTILYETPFPDIENYAHAIPKSMSEIVIRKIKPISRLINQPQKAAQFHL